METLVRWTGPDTMSFVAETGSGHAVVMDGAPEGGGRNLGPRPMEMVLLGTGGCTAYDVVVGMDTRGLEAVLARLDKTKPVAILLRRGEWAQYTLIRPLK